MLRIKFQIFVISNLNTDCILRLLPFVDPEGTAINRKNIFSNVVNQLKSIDEILRDAHNSWDFTILDRSELNWPQHLHSRIVLLKTFAPLTGAVADRSLTTFPIFCKTQNISLDEKLHFLTPEDISKEISLGELSKVLLKSFKMVQVENKSVMGILRESTCAFYRNKKVSLQFYYPDIPNCKDLRHNDSNLIAIQEILVRITAVVVWDGAADFFVVHQKLQSHKHTRLTVVDKRKDVQDFLRGELKKEMGGKYE